MKKFYIPKLNEDVVISDPTLASQYANAQKQIIDKDKQINALQKQINNLESQKVQLGQAMAQIEQKSAQNQVKEQPTQQPKQTDQEKTQQQIQQSSQAAEILAQNTGESLSNVDPLSILIVESDKEDKDDEEESIQNLYDKSEKYKQQYNNIESDIENLEYNIKQLKSKFEQPNYEGIEGEIENFLAFLTDEESEILNMGHANVEEKIKDLMGGFSKSKSGEDFKSKLFDKKPKKTKEEAQLLINDYYYYYPENDPRLDKERKEAKKEIEKDEKFIEKLEKKLGKLENKISKLENKIWDIENPKEETEFHQEYKEDKPEDWFVSPSFTPYNEAYVEINKEKEKSKEDYLDKNYVFYVKIIEDEKTFIGKIFKISPDGDWYGVVKFGESPTFEKMNYEPTYNEVDIIEFLGNNYESIEVIDTQEFNEYVEDNENIIIEHIHFE